MKVQWTIVVFTLVAILYSVVFAQDSLNVREIGSVYQYWYRSEFLRTQDDLGYIMGNKTGLRIVDLSDFEEISEIGYFPYNGAVDGFEISGTLAAFSEPQVGIHIIDISNENDIHELSLIDAPIELRCLTLSQNYLFASAEDSLLVTYDLSDPTHPQIISTYISPMVNDIRGSVRNVTLSDTLLFVANYLCGLRILNFADPSNPDEIGFYSEDGYAVEYLNYVNNRLLISGFINGPMLFDVSDPSTPRLIAQGGFGSYNAKLHENFVFSITRSDVIIFDLTDIDNPQLVGRYSPGSSLSDFRMIDRTVYVLDRNEGLFVSDFNNPANVVPMGAYRGQETVRQVAISSNQALIAKRSDGISVVDISDPTNPLEIGSMSGLGIAVCVLPYEENLALVADYTAGLHIIDITDVRNPEQIGFTDELQDMVDMMVVDHYLYVADDWNGLNIVDLTEPTSPEIVGTLDVYCDDVVVNGNYVYISTTNSLAAIDVTNQQSPVMQSEVMLDRVVELAIWSNFVLVSTGNELVFVNVENPDSIYIASTYFIEDIVDIAVSGDRAVVVESGKGIHIIDLTNYIEPHEVGFYKTRGHPRSVAIDEEIVYLAEGIRLGVYNISEAHAGVNEENDIFIPQSLTLNSPHPNPFNSTTTIGYSLPIPSDVKLRVCDLTGQLIATLVSEHQTAGQYTVPWDAQGVGSGIYFLRLETQNGSHSQKLMLVK